jgi:hypothetical protein
MAGKNFGRVIAVVGLLWIGAGPAQAEDGQCAQLLRSVCNGCHDSARICAKIGGPEKKWLTLLDWMISNGAELEDEEKNLLANCMTEPFAEAKTFCGK